MLFKVIAGKDVFELNPSLKAIEQFERLTSRQMTYVILSTDYKSPFRRLPPDERKLQAALAAGYKTEKESDRPDMNCRNLITGKVGSVQAAIETYNKLQLDSDYEALKSVSSLINDIITFNNQPNKSIIELDKAVSITVNKLDKLVETKKRLEEILNMRDEEVVDSSLDPDVKAVSESDLPFLSVFMDGDEN